VSGLKHYGVAFISDLPWDYSPAPCPRCHGEETNKAWRGRGRCKSSLAGCDACMRVVWEWSDGQIEGLPPDEWAGLRSFGLGLQLAARECAFHEWYSARNQVEELRERTNRWLAKLTAAVDLARRTVWNERLDKARAVHRGFGEPQTAEETVSWLVREMSDCPWRSFALSVLWEAIEEERKHEQARVAWGEMMKAAGEDQP
jgi:hypothetical protein